MDNLDSFTLIMWLKFARIDENYVIISITTESEINGKCNILRVLLKNHKFTLLGWWETEIVLVIILHSVISFKMNQFFPHSQRLLKEQLQWNVAI